MKNQKSKLLLLSLLLASTLLFSCSSKTTSNNDKVKVVCTIFPEYDWTRTIIGEENENIDLSLVVKNGVDLHSFQPSTTDVLEITTADVFVYVGGISDNWVTDVLKNSKNKDMKVVNLMDVLGDRVQIKEIPEGMEACLDHDHSHNHNHDSESSDFDEIEFTHTHNEPVYDEHIWLSLQNAELCCKAITNALSEVLPENKNDFENNLNTYLSKLRSLNDDFSNTVNNAREKTLIFCDRFPFRYLVEDYGLNYYAAFSGCSAETEASFETIAFLAHKLQTTGLNAVITIDNSDNKIANTVIQNAKRPDCKIMTLDSMQSTKLEDALNGKTYLSTMTSNLDALKEALK